MPKDAGSLIQNGDFITTSLELAKDYAGNEKMIQTMVRYGDILDDEDGPEGDEYILRRNADAELRLQD